MRTAAAVGPGAQRVPRDSDATRSALSILNMRVLPDDSPRALASIAPADRRAAGTASTDQLYKTRRRACSRTMQILAQKRKGALSPVRLRRLHMRLGDGRMWVGMCVHELQCRGPETRSWRYPNRSW